MNDETYFEKLIKWIKTHKCIFIIICIFIYNLDFFCANAIAPIRCAIGKSKDKEVFLTSDEWKKMSKIRTSLKGTNWVYYNNKVNKKKNNEFIYFDNKKYELYYTNQEYPNLNIYIYEDEYFVISDKTVVLYDEDINSAIVKYTSREQFYYSTIIGYGRTISCNEDNILSLIKNYLN